MDLERRLLVREDDGVEAPPVLAVAVRRGRRPARQHARESVVRGPRAPLGDRAPDAREEAVAGRPGAAVRRAR